LHKYMYAGGDPVNLADPSGRQTAVVRGNPIEYGEILLSISIASIAAVDVLACGVNIRLAMDALQAEGYTNVVPVWFLCSAKGTRWSCKANCHSRTGGAPGGITIRTDIVGHGLGGSKGQACDAALEDASNQAKARGLWCGHQHCYDCQQR